MQRRFCDFCNGEVEDSNPHAVLDQDTIFEGKRVVVRVDLREHKTAADIKRPDVCRTCQQKIVAQVLRLNPVIAESDPHNTD